MLETGVNESVQPVVDLLDHQFQQLLQNDHVAAQAGVE